jgi:Ca2+-binding RTX toxin-like protein
MTVYAFETITSDQALALTTADTVTFTKDDAVTVAVVFSAPNQILLSTPTRDVIFNAQIAPLAQAGGLIFADGSHLYIGGSAPDTYRPSRDDAHNIAFYGGAGDDRTTFGGAGHALIQGNGGDDILVGDAGNTTIYGGKGDDELSVSGSKAVNFVQGNLGDDTVLGGDRTDILLGGQGNDSVAGGAGADYLDGNLGDDQITLRGDQDQAFGEGGSDSIASLTSSLDSARHSMHGGAGDDYLLGTSFGAVGEVGGSNFMWGDEGDDRIVSSSPKHDELYGGAGDDQLSTSGGGRDVLDGGSGDDTLASSTDSLGDTMIGGDGNDVFFANAGRNSIDGGAGNDNIMDNARPENGTIHGGLGNDTITALPGVAEKFMLSGGAPLIYGDDGDDFIKLGLAGMATIDGGSGNDTLSAGFGDSYIPIGNWALGGDGDDSLTGGVGSYLDGGAGADTIQATIQPTLDGGVSMSITGGDGSDVFVMGVNSAGFGPREHTFPMINDWSHEDRLRVLGLSGGQLDYRESIAASVDNPGAGVILTSSNQVFVVQAGLDVLVYAVPTAGDAHGLSIMTLVGRSLADIDASNIVS